jgi:hypothetical protein
LVAGATIILSSKTSNSISASIIGWTWGRRQKRCCPSWFMSSGAQSSQREVMRSVEDWGIEHRWSWRKTMVQHGDAPTACWLWNCFLMFSPEDIRVIASIPKNHGARCFSLLTFVGTAPRLCSLRFWWLTFVQ